MGSKKTLTLQDIRRRRQAALFVGRSQYIDLFRQNLDLPIEAEERLFIFNAFGQGGVGKTYLLNRFRNYAVDASALIGWCDEAEKDVPSVMSRIAIEFEQQGYPLKSFIERYKTYRQCRQELEADPEAPKGFAALVGRSVAKTGLRLAKGTPAGVIVDFLDEDSVAAQASELATYVARKLTNKDEVRLVRNPIEELTPLLLKDIQKIPEDTRIVLFFDTYEHTSEYLEEWLLNLLDTRYGAVAANIIWVIGGRDELNKNLWGELLNLTARISLKPFTDDEARQYLSYQGIHEERVIEVILNLSGNLPVLIAILADESPDDAENIGDPSGTAIDRFLKWVDDPQRRQVALDAALPRRLNRDILSILIGEEHSDKLFTWLTNSTFVEKRSDAWTYHEVVRALMLRRRHQESPHNWAELHGRLADYYDGLRANTGIEAQGPSWQLYTLEILYHRTCQEKQKHLPKALNEFLGVSFIDPNFARRWAETLQQAGKEGEVDEIQRWGTRLLNGLRAQESGQDKVAAEMFSAILKVNGLNPLFRLLALRSRGFIYIEAGEYLKAIADLTEVINEQPTDAWVLYKRGFTYRRIKRFDEAVSDFQQALNLDPKLTHLVKTEMGIVFFEQQNYEKAAEAFKEALIKEAKCDECWMFLLRSYAVLHPRAEAFSLIRDFTVLDSDSPFVIAARANALKVINYYEEALAELDRAIQMEPNSDSILIHRGEIHAHLRHYDQSLEDLNKAIEIDPDNSWAFIHLCKTYRSLKRKEDALSAIEKAIEVDPQNAYAFYMRGVIHRQMENYTEALEDLRQSIQIDKDIESLAELEVGKVLQEKQSYKQAAEAYRRVIEIEPANGSAWEGLAIAYAALYPRIKIPKLLRSISIGGTETASIISARARGLTELRFSKEALEELTQAKELDPQNVKAQTYLGEVYRQLGNFDEALKNLDRSIELDPESAYTYLKRGKTRRYMQQYEQALNDLQLAIELDIDYEHETRKEIGKVLYARREYERAAESFIRAIELDIPCVESWIFLAKSYSHLYSPEEAPDALRRISIPKAAQLTLNYFRIEAMKAIHQYEQALKDFDLHFVERENHYFSMRNQRGLLLSCLNRYEEAIDNYKQDLENEPNYFLTSYHIAVAMFRWKGLVPAQQYISRSRTALQSILRSGVRSEALYGLAGLEALVGNKFHALEHLEQALSLGGNNLRLLAMHDLAWQELNDDPKYQEIVFKDLSD